MPCDYSNYPANWKTEIRPAILMRAGNKCEICGADNGDMIRPIKCCLEPLINEDGRCASCGKRPKKVVLTIMHLDHDTTNNDFLNLRAGCQRCHLLYDADHHRKNAAATRIRKQVGNVPPLPGMEKFIDTNDKMTRMKGE